MVNEEKNRKKFLKGIAQNGCLLPNLCCPEGLTPFLEHTAQCSLFTESGMEAKISLPFTERSAQQAPIVCCQTPVLKHLVWLLIFFLRISNFCLLLFRLLLPAQRVVIPGQVWSGCYWVRYGGGTREKAPGPSLLQTERPLPHSPCSECRETETRSHFWPGVSTLGLSDGWSR